MVPRHWRLVFRGIFADTPEIWSHSHSLTEATNDVRQLDLDPIEQAWRTMASALLTSEVRLTDIRAYSIGTDRKMIGEPALKLFPVGQEPRGGTGGVNYPTQVALAVTTQGSDRGPGRFGRFYLPGPRFALMADRRIGATDQGTAATRAAAFLTAIRDAVNVQFAPDVLDAYPINVSTLGGDGAGSYQRVNNVRVGRVLDTIRSRRNALDEAYVAVDL